MGNFTVTKWRCDRCKIELDERPAKPFGGVYTLVATENHDWAGGVVFDWKDLCQKCNDVVGAIIHEAQMVKP